MANRKLPFDSYFICAGISCILVAITYLAGWAAALFFFGVFLVFMGLA